MESLGVPEKDIFVYDLCVPISEENMRKRILYNIKFVDLFEPRILLEKLELRLGTKLQCADYKVKITMQNRIKDEKGKDIACYMPKLISQAQNIINMPIMTKHVFISSSGPLKNHFGTVRFSNFDSDPRVLHGKNIEQSVVDINANEHIKSKTRLIVVDALLGMYSRGEDNKIKKWKTFPCKNGISNSLFFSKDPIAKESITNDYIESERQMQGAEVISSQHLYYGMKKGLGLYERRDANGKYDAINYVERGNYKS